MINITQSVIEAALSNAGIEMTPQRFAVLDYLACRPPAVVGDIVEVMIRHYPRPSAASIRRTLDTLRDAGVIEETVSKNGELYYEINIHQNDLLTCADCEDD